jgi:translation initiation factor IF-2
VAGLTTCRVRQIYPPNSTASVKSAVPGDAVQVTGWDDLPLAGDQVLEAKDAKEAATAGRNRKRRVERAQLLEEVEVINEKRRTESEASQAAAAAARARPKGIIGNDPLAQEPKPEEEEQGPKELKLVVKADVSGTIEAVVGAIEGIGNKLARVKILSQGVGDVSPADVAMAKSAKGQLQVARFCRRHNFNFFNFLF